MKSSDFLFHYTPKLENIFSIIENGIWVKRTVEDFSFLRELTPEIDFDAVFGASFQSESEKTEEDYRIKLAMACFCDIPANEAHRHSEIYGKYALGFDKSWGVERGINPISYLVPESDLSVAIRNLNTLTAEISTQSPDYRIRNAFLKIVSFLKLYEGPYTKDEYKNENHRYYDEREWRYVIKGDFEKIAPPDKLSDSEDIRHKLSFSIEDIRFIIVNSDDEIPAISNHFSEKGINLETYPHLLVTSFESIFLEKEKASKVKSNLTLNVLIIMAMILVLIAVFIYFG